MKKIHSSNLRFQFGKNWMKYIKNINQNKIDLAKYSMKKMYDIDFRSDENFLDIGCGSGLFSLCAKEFGLSVHSFDFDNDSVECTRMIKDKFHPNDKNWNIEQGSILDKSYISGLDKYNYVYSWGVLHHTGDMYLAMDNAASLVKKNGLLYIALYNYQPFLSSIWTKIKRIYNRSNFLFKSIIIFFSVLYLWLPKLLFDMIKLKPFNSWINYSQTSLRGMSPWTDLLDWVGGYPFEVASPDVIINFYIKKGFQLKKIKTVGGKLGCNEYLFINKQ
mgnify:CR=1 FL=1